MNQIARIPRSPTELPLVSGGLHCGWQMGREMIAPATRVPAVSRRAPLRLRAVIDDQRVGLVYSRRSAAPLRDVICDPAHDLLHLVLLLFADGLHRGGSSECPQTYTVRGAPALRKRAPLPRVRSGRTARVRSRCSGRSAACSIAAGSLCRRSASWPRPPAGHRRAPLRAGHADPAIGAVRGCSRQSTVGSMAARCSLAPARTRCPGYSRCSTAGSIAACFPRRIPGMRPRVPAVQRRAPLRPAGRLR